MKEEQVHIALVANERYRPGLLATRRSMEDACADRARLVFHELGDADLEPFLSRFPLESYNGSKLPYLRLFLPEILPDCDWVIYSDVDTLWFKDPCALWAERDDSRSVCWVKDLDLSGMDFARWTRAKGIMVPAGGVYACSGIALINLKKWRETNFTERALAFLRQWGCPPYADQDVMNMLLRDDAKMLSEDWDCMIPPYFGRPCVYHLTGLGRQFGDETYSGTVPHYVFWYNFYRQRVQGLPPMVLGMGRRCRFAVMRVLYRLVSPVLALLDAFPGPYAWKRLLMRMRRQLSFARLTEN